ncbi:sigma(X)-activator ComW [Streptococcus sp. DD10]|uniref:sigma(X)-activator ComW n=1 Tax=Streptococcus sp. DD10 TaxID=1777878 RepID=UPI0009EF4D43
MIEEVYKEYREVDSTLERNFDFLKLDRYEWESLHLRYFISYKNLSNDGFAAFHYSSYGTFSTKNRLHNSYSGFTHYRNYRAKRSC